jgi:hypothetical protein
MTRAAKVAGKRTFRRRFVERMFVLPTFAGVSKELVDAGNGVGGIGLVQPARHGSARRNFCPRIGKEEVNRFGTERFL